MRLLADWRAESEVRIVVDMRRELPDGWKAMCEQAGIPGSARGIAAAAGLAVTTVQRLVFERRTSEATVAAVASALRVDRQVVKSAAGIGGDQPDWFPPSEAQKLSPKTREALNRLILAVAEEVSNAGRSPKDQKTDEQQEPERQEGGSSDGRQSEAQKSGQQGSVIPIRRRWPGPVDSAHEATAASDESED